MLTEIVVVLVVAVAAYFVYRAFKSDTPVSNEVDSPNVSRVVEVAPVVAPVVEDVPVVVENNVINLADVPSTAAKPKAKKASGKEKTTRKKIAKK